MRQISNNYVSYYDVLDVSPQSSDGDIKHAYRRLAFEFHPDKNPHDKRMAELRLRMINEAYRHLKTREKRHLYNSFLRRQRIPLKTRQEHHNDNGALDNSSWLLQLAEKFWPNPKHKSN